MEDVAEVGTCTAGHQRVAGFLASQQALRSEAQLFVALKGPFVLLLITHSHADRRHLHPL